MTFKKSTVLMVIALLGYTQISFADPGQRRAAAVGEATLAGVGGCALSGAAATFMVGLYGIVNAVDGYKLPPPTKGGLSAIAGATCLLVGGGAAISTYRDVNSVSRSDIQSFVTTNRGKVQNATTPMILVPSNHSGTSGSGN